MSRNSKSAGAASPASRVGPGASTKPTSKSKEAGPIFIVPSTKRERPSISCCAKRDVAAAKAFFRRAFMRQGRLPHKITLDGYQASHRAAKEALDEHPEGNQCEIRSLKYLNNRIEQDHRSIKLRLGPMLGLKRFEQRRRSPASNSCTGSGRISSNSASFASKIKPHLRFGMRPSLLDRRRVPAPAWLDLPRLHQIG